MELSKGTIVCDRRTRWRGITLPAYPDGAGYHPRQPQLSQIKDALAGLGPEVWRVWVQRLRLLNPARWAALYSAFQAGKSLYRLKYVSDRRCRRCSGAVRSAVSDQCSKCYKSTRFTAQRKHSEAELRQRERERIQRESSALIPCIVAGSTTGWIVMLDADGVRFWHPSKTGRVLRHLEPILHRHFMQHDQHYRQLFLFAVENQPLPEWATIMYQS